MAIPPLSASTTMSGISPHFSGAGSSAGMSALQQGRMRKQIDQIAGDAVNSVITNLNPDVRAPKTTQQQAIEHQNALRQIGQADAQFKALTQEVASPLHCSSGKCAHPEHIGTPLQNDVFSRKAGYDAHPKNSNDRFESKKAQLTTQAKQGLHDHYSPIVGHKPMVQPAFKPEAQIPPVLADGTLFNQLLDNITKSVTETANQFTNVWSTYSPNTNSNANRTPSNFSRALFRSI